VFRRLTLSSLLLLPLAVFGETAGDYLHRGAQKYIFGDEPGAKTELTTGLQKFPTAEELRQMLALIREQQKKEQQNKDAQKKEQAEQSEDKDQKQEQKKDGEKPEPKPGDEQKDDPKPGGKGDPADEQGGDKEKELNPDKDGDVPQPAEKKPEGELKANPSDVSSKPGGDKEAEDAAAEEAAEAKGEMTERQAKALLDSLKGEDERVHLIDPKDRKRARGILRDW
jgi:hypothetical protein